jgi:hypothetical protein
VSKLDFSAIAGHVEHESAPQAGAPPVLDFSAIPGHVQHSDGAAPDHAREALSAPGDPNSGNMPLPSKHPITKSDRIRS